MSYRGNRATRVTVDGDRHIIQTDARRAEAILLVLSGATLQEVGTRFGVTRERIRQYLLDAGLTPQIRVRTNTTKTAQRKMEQFKNHSARRQGWFEERQIRIRNAVLVIQMFKSEHGRPPTHLELYRLVRQSEPRKGWQTYGLAQWLGRTDYSGKNASRGIRALYRLAGCPGRRRGCWTGRVWMNRKRKSA